jgi:hypothetical protein
VSPTAVSAYTLAMWELGAIVAPGDSILVAMFLSLAAQHIR